MPHKPPINLADWIWRIVFVSFLAGQTYFASQFVNRTDFSRAVQRLDEVRDKVLVIEQAVKNTDGIETRIQAMGERINALEREKAAYEIRLTAVEKKVRL